MDNTEKFEEIKLKIDKHKPSEIFTYGEFAPGVKGFSDMFVERIFPGTFNNYGLIEGDKIIKITKAVVVSNEESMDNINKIFNSDPKIDNEPIILTIHRKKTQDAGGKRKSTRRKSTRRKSTKRKSTKRKSAKK